MALPAFFEIVGTAVNSFGLDEQVAQAVVVSSGSIGALVAGLGFIPFIPNGYLGAAAGGTGGAYLGLRVMSAYLNLLAEAPWEDLDLSTISEQAVTFASRQFGQG